MKKISYIAAALLLGTGGAYAQRNLGIATSDWSGMNGLYLNPASIANSRERIVIDLFSVNAGFDNSLGSINSIGNLFGAIESSNADDFFKYSNRNTFSLLAPHAEVRGPGFKYSINHHHSIAVTTGVRGFNQFNSFDQSLFRTLSDPDYTYTGSESSIDLTSRKFNYTAQVWTQTGISYGAVIFDKREHVVRVGVTLRYLAGVGYLGLKGNNLDAHYRPGYDSLFVRNSDLEFASNVLSTRSAVLNGFSNNNMFDRIFGKKQGQGWGGDIGVMYDYMPRPDKRQHVDGDSRYRLRLSASVTDFGRIDYKKANNSNANVSGNGYITGKGLRDNVSNFDEFRAYAKKQGFKADTISKDVSVYMPTSLILGADYYIRRQFFVNATFIGNLANRNTFGNSYYGQVTVTPRYENKLYTVAMPITYGMLSQSMKVGLGLRFTGLYIGSDDMLALFAKGQYGFNFYVGGFVPIYKHRKGHHWRPMADTTDMMRDYEMDRENSADTSDDSPEMSYINTSSRTHISERTMRSGNEPGEVAMRQDEYGLAGEIKEIARID